MMEVTGEVSAEGNGRAMGAWTILCLNSFMFIFLKRIDIYYYLPLQNFDKSEHVASGKSCSNRGDTLNFLLLFFVFYFQPIPAFTLIP